MRVVFLVPRRNDGGHRDRLWAWCRARWQQYLPDIAIYEGHHDDGPFNRAAAVNEAARLADLDGRWDVGIVIDSDVFLRVSDVRAAIDRATETGKVTWPHLRWRELREDWTDRVLREPMDLGPEPTRDEMDLLVGVTNPISWSCCIVIPRAIWDDIGGFDERFRGWGWEDMAFQSLITGLYGYERLGGDVLNLWHPRSPERIVKGQPRSTASQAYITNARLGRRYMLAARRDHNVHDRVKPADEAERQRDIANLLADDRKWSVEAKRQGLPDWDDWWPTLEELRDGAKLARSGVQPRITVVVRTGGEEASWPERSQYLAASLESLAANLSGEIAKCVVYSDWDQSHTADLERIAGPHGFYVVGGGHYGYVGSIQRLWRYIERRAVGEFIFLTEDDFLYERKIELGAMVQILRQHREVQQVALLREPAYPREFAPGTILGWPMDEFTPRDGYLEHRLFWTMNPSLVRRSIVENAWPAADSSERVFGDKLLRDPAARFAFLGSGEAWARHIGETRAVANGVGY